MQALHAETHRRIYQITTNRFLDRESEVEHRHLLQEAEQISLRTRGNKWHLHKRLRGHKLIPRQDLSLARLEVTLMPLHCP